MGTSGAEIGAAFGGNKVSVLDILVYWLITLIMFFRAPAGMFLSL